MSTPGWIMMVAHTGLFFYLRFTTTRKKKQLQRQLAACEVENFRLRAENQSLLKMLDDKYE